MKHKRQTLSKSEDGDDKDSTTSEGGKSSKTGLDKFHDDDGPLSGKKSCQGCELPPGALCSPAEDLPELTSRTRNNNTPSATNNNSFASDGASSVASSSSLDKLAEDDSREAHLAERPATITAPRTLAKRIKQESRKRSPSLDANVCKISPSSSKDGVPMIPGLDGAKYSSVNLTPSSTPGTPSSLHQSPLGHYPRPSPPSVSTGPHAQALPNNMPPYIARGNAPPGQYVPHPDFRMESKQFIGKLGQYSQVNRTYEGYTAGQSAEQHSYGRNQPHTRQEPSSATRTPNGLSGRHAYTQEVYQNYAYPTYAKDQVGYGHVGYDPAQNYAGEHANYPNNHYGYHYHEGTPQETHGYYAGEGQKTAYSGEYSKAAYYEANSSYSGHPQGYAGGSSAAVAASTATAQPATSAEGYESGPGEGYSSFQQFYEATHAAPPADNSNSSSDFHFLSNLANDFGPEYYSI